MPESLGGGLRVRLGMPPAPPEPFGFCFSPTPQYQTNVQRSTVRLSGCTTPAPPASARAIGQGVGVEEGGAQHPLIASPACVNPT